MFVSILACAIPDPVSASSALPVVSEVEQLIPAGNLPPEVVDQPSNNNLDVVVHDGETFLAFRTAPTHFASSETELYVLRESASGWAFETAVRMETDLREPRFLSWNGELLLYFAVLGANPADFEPQGSMLTVRSADGAWSAPASMFDDTFIPWRARVVNGVPYLVGYTGGADIYDGGTPKIEVKWLTSTDGRTWAPVAGDGTVEVGGGSETDWVFLDDGGVLAVTRNEAGDETGWGSKICRSSGRDPAAWACVNDPRKYDSPLMFREGGRNWLIGRRNVTDDGHYDLGRRDLSFAQQTLFYEAEYWNQPKRCSLWEVDSDTLIVTWVLDLPSQGDTCFPSALDEGEGRWRVTNYSSPIDGDDPVWHEGQLGPTHVYRQLITFP